MTWVTARQAPAGQWWGPNWIRRHANVAGSSSSWGELAEHLTAYVAEMGPTHVELMPVIEHPFGGRRVAVLDAKASAYAGSGVGNLGSIDATPAPWQDQPASAVLVVPPAGVLWLTPAPTHGTAVPPNDGDTP